MPVALVAGPKINYSRFYKISNPYVTELEIGSDCISMTSHEFNPKKLIEELDPKFIKIEQTQNKKGFIKVEEKIDLKNKAFFYFDQNNKRINEKAINYFVSYIVTPKENTSIKKEFQNFTLKELQNSIKMGKIESVVRLSIPKHKKHLEKIDSILAIIKKLDSSSLYELNKDHRDYLRELNKQVLKNMKINDNNNEKYRVEKRVGVLALFIFSIIVVHQYFFKKPLGNKKKNLESIEDEDL